MTSDLNDKNIDDNRYNDDNDYRNINGNYDNYDYNNDIDSSLRIILV
jgi:hypothetical protein